MRAFKHSLLRVLLLPYFMKCLFEITQIWTQNARLAMLNLFIEFQFLQNECLTMTLTMVKILYYGQNSVILN